MQDCEPYFNEVYAATYRPLLRYAVVHLPEPLDAEDLLQNVFLRFYRRVKLRGHRDIDAPYAFLLTMLRRELATNYMHRASRTEHETVLDSDCLPGDGEDLELRVVTAAAAESIFSAARALTPECYRVFVLYYGFDLSVETIASALRIGREAVKSRLFRARRAIRQTLTEKGEIAL